VGTFYALLAESERRPVTELYGVFRRSRNEADRLAGELAARCGAMDFGPGFSSHEELGEVREQDGRLLLAGLGGDEDLLYAAPTTTGYVAYALLANAGGGCGPPGPDGLVLGWTQTDQGDLVVHGLVADPIEAVDIVVAGMTHPAWMGENAFGLRLERTHESDLERVVLHRRDGSTNAIDLRG
jgi:hypothetical protein